MLPEQTRQFESDAEITLAFDIGSTEHKCIR